MQKSLSLFLSQTKLYRNSSTSLPSILQYSFINLIVDNMVHFHSLSCSMMQDGQKVAVGTFVMFTVSFHNNEPQWSSSLSQLFPSETQHKAKPERHLHGHLDTLEALSSFTNRPIITVNHRQSWGGTTVMVTAENIAAIVKLCY